MSDNHPETELDVTGLLCPLPVLRARKMLERLPSGSILVLRASDPMSAIDVPHFCTEQGHALLAQDHHASIFSFRIKRK
jgi:tRNA 2-thiouridine synthesizing protein A